MSRAPTPESRREQPSAEQSVEGANVESVVANELTDIEQKIVQITAKRDKLQADMGRYSAGLEGSRSQQEDAKKHGDADLLKTYDADIEALKDRHDALEGQMAALMEQLQEAEAEKQRLLLVQNEKEDDIDKDMKKKKLRQEERVGLEQKIRVTNITHEYYESDEKQYGQSSQRTLDPQNREVADAVATLKMPPPSERNEENRTDSDTRSQTA